MCSVQMRELPREKQVPCRQAEDIVELAHQGLMGIIPASRVELVGLHVDVGGVGLRGKVGEWGM